MLGGGPKQPAIQMLVQLKPNQAVETAAAVLARHGIANPPRFPIALPDSVAAHGTVLWAVSGGKLKLGFNWRSLADSGAPDVPALLLSHLIPRRDSASSVRDDVLAVARTGRTAHESELAIAMPGIQLERGPNSLAPFVEAAIDELVRELRTKGQLIWVGPLIEAALLPKDWPAHPTSWGEMVRAGKRARKQARKEAR
ncbi:MAG: hypothetical protein LBJ62_03160 [Bifidobacteriaceae bacterium]|jgi:hypothetical protein|nr:hypothetical protein [Bifidobacteriaceae bacterium]